MTFAAPDPDGVRAFPPPAPDELSSPGPSSWAPPLPPPTGAAAIEPSSDVAEREPGDAFELIWPTGEVDDDIDGPLSEEPSHGAHPSDTATPSDPVPSAEPITVVLRPVAPPTEVAEPSSTAPVDDDVVLAVRRAIAALGSESAGADDPAPPRRLPGATSGDPSKMRSPSEPSDERRSALKRLISGLRRH